MPCPHNPPWYEPGRPLITRGHCCDCRKDHGFCTGCGTFLEEHRRGPVALWQALNRAIGR